jgi:UPF0042 nucleotide-binding protein
MTKRSILFITGLSGAGISTSLKALEDIGYEVFDNFPLSQVFAVLNEEGFEDKPIALGFDSRTRAFNPDNMIKMAQDTGARLVFLNATNDALHKRFSETRRMHPLAKDRTVTDGIVHERKWLEPLAAAADLKIDTTDLNVHDLKRLVEAEFTLEEKPNKLSVTVMSFGYKNGVPREVDMVLDVRFLKNPHWDSTLQPKTGKETDVQAYVQSDDNFDEFLKKTQDYISFLLPRYAAEGKSYFTIAFGCTGGRHRSVFLTEKTGDYIQSLGYSVTTRHRDL